MDLPALQVLARMLGSEVKGHGRNIMFSCPLAPKTHKGGADRNPSFSVSVAPDGPSLAICWTCGAKGSLVSVLEEADVVVGGFSDVLRHARDVEGCRLFGAFSRMSVSDSGTTQRWDEYVARCARQVPEYILRRGVTAQELAKWRIGFDADLGREDQAKGYAVFPIVDEDGVVHGASRRACFDQTPRWWMTPGTRKDDVFFGEQFIDSTRGVVHIVEGPMDAVVASRCLPNVIANLGTNTPITPKRLAKLRRWAKSIVLIFDGDIAGKSAVYGSIGKDGEAKPGLIDTLRQFFMVRVVDLPEGADPACLASSELCRAVDCSGFFPLTVQDFLITSLRGAFPRN